jgi:hypothetical protein
MLNRRGFGAGLGAVALPGLVVGCATTAVSAGNATAQVHITLGETSGPTIDRRFLGLSYEKNTLATRLFDPADANLVRLFRALGEGVLRVGAYQVDRALWQPNDPGLTAGFTAPADISRLADFIRATGWTVIYGVNLAANDRQASADEAALAATLLGPALLGIEIGNEADIYHSNGLRPRDYQYAQFEREWQAFADAIRARIPGVTLTGPATAFNWRDYTLPFARDHGRDIALLTQHYYRANGLLASSTVALLLQPDPALPGMLRSVHAAATENHIRLGYRLAEANSYSRGGAPNVSSSYGSALWLLDFLITLAREGASGVNLHGGGNGPGYTPIADDGRGPVEARPEYAALLLFSRLAGGRQRRMALETDGLNLSALAASVPDGSTRVLLVNKDAQRPAFVSLPGPAREAHLTRLTGLSLDSRAGVTLGGRAVPADGSWHGTRETVAGDPLTITLPAASAVLAEL